MRVPYAIAACQHGYQGEEGLTACRDESEQSTNRPTMRDDTTAVQEQPRSNRTSQRDHLHVPLLHLALHAVVQLRVHVDLDVLLGVVLIPCLRVSERGDGVHVDAFVVHNVFLGSVHDCCGVEMSTAGPKRSTSTFIVPRQRTVSPRMAALCAERVGTRQSRSYRRCPSCAR